MNAARPGLPQEFAITRVHLAALVFVSMMFGALFVVVLAAVWPFGP